MLEKFVRVRVPHVDRNKVLHKAAHGTHLAYFAAVFLEGHGVYAMAGGGLFIFAVLNFFLHFDE